MWTWFKTRTYNRYDLNFFAFFAAFSEAGSPLTIFSAPTFRPSVLQPYLGLKIFPQSLQDESASIRLTHMKRVLTAFMDCFFVQRIYAGKIAFTRVNVRENGSRTYEI